MCLAVAAERDCGVGGAHEWVTLKATGAAGAKRERKKGTFFCCDKGSATPQAVSTVAEVLLAKTSSASNCSSSNSNEPKRSYLLCWFWLVLSPDETSKHTNKELSSHQVRQALIKKETHNELQCKHMQPCTVNRHTHTHTHIQTLTWDHTGDLGEEAFDSPDGDTSCFFILYSCNDVFNLWEAQRESVLKVKENNATGSIMQFVFLFMEN